MRLFGDHNDVTVIVQLGSHRLPHPPDGLGHATKPHPERLRANRHESLATAFFINSVAASTRPVKKEAKRNAKTLGPQPGNH
jgi:hypothetical protein